MENELVKLKARAYDLIAVKERATNELAQVNQAIAVESQKQMAEEQKEDTSDDKPVK